MLTEKELQILLLRKEGLTQSEIAKRLRITQGAVSRFEANAKEKIRESLTHLELLRRLKVEHGQEPIGVDDLLRRWAK